MLLSAFSSSLFSVFTNHIVSILTLPSTQSTLTSPLSVLAGIQLSMPSPTPFEALTNEKGDVGFKCAIDLHSNLFETHWENKMKIQCKIHQKLQTTDLLQNYYLECPFKPQKIENEKQQSFFIKQASFQMSKLFKNKKKNPNE